MHAESRQIIWSRVILPAIIIVIAVLAFYKFACIIQRRRQEARRAGCMRHLQDIILALDQYALDNEDTFPWDSTMTDRYYRLFGKLCPDYTPSPDIFRCPSSSDGTIPLDEARKAGSSFTEEECRKGLSYAYGHNRGKPWSRSDPASVHLVADKYTTHDYRAEPYPAHRPLNHTRGSDFQGNWVSSVPKFGKRNAAAIDLSANCWRDLGPLEADPETEFENSGDPEHDQTGRDWWSDPPDK